MVAKNEERVFLNMIMRGISRISRVRCIETGHSHILNSMLCTIAGLTLFLFLSPLQWYGRQLITDPFKGVVLALLPLVCLLRLKSMKRIHPSFSLVPGLLFGVSIIAYLVNENYLGVHIFSAALCIAALYCLLGFTLSKQQWKDLFIPFGLAILLLPFEGYLDIYLGFPLRLLCAEWAGDMVQALGFSSMSNESIILVEDKAAMVDLGCSGIKGLWAGSIFFLLLSIVEGCRVSWRLLAVGIGFLGCLLTANVFRIVVLVLLGVVANLASLADLLHLSLGLLGFSSSCLLAWMGIRFICQKPVYEKERIESGGSQSAASLTLVIIGLLFALWLHQPYQPHFPLKTFNFTLPDALQPKIVQLTDVERTFFRNNQALTQKLKFDFHGVTGSALIVSSNYWKGQHEPRNCYLGQGHDIGFEGSWLLSNDTVVRFLQIDNGTKTAVYWFQSVGQVTPDYSSRVFGGILHPQKNWLMVSILWNQPMGQREAEKVLLRIQGTLAEQLINGGNDGE
jgi:exosortase O